MTAAISAESSCRRSYFYVGGHYVEHADGSYVLIGQMYVECLEPMAENKHPWPVVFIQGAGQTGTVSRNLCFGVGLFFHFVTIQGSFARRRGYIAVNTAYHNLLYTLEVCTLAPNLT